MVEIISNEDIINGNLHARGYRHPIADVVSSLQQIGGGLSDLGVTDIREVLAYCSEQKCDDSGARYCSGCYKWDESSPNMWETAKLLLDRGFMKKRIHHAYPSGLYTKNTFTEFMNGLEGAVPVSDDTLVPWKHSNDRTSTAITYHIEPHGVTLRYLLLATETVMGQRDTTMASVVLAGKPENISKVEEIILLEADKYKE